MSAQVAADLRARADRYALTARTLDMTAARLMAAGAPEAAINVVLFDADRFMGRAFETDAAADRAEADQ